MIFRNVSDKSKENVNVPVWSKILRTFLGQKIWERLSLAFRKCWMEWSGLSLCGRKTFFLESYFISNNRIQSHSYSTSVSIGYDRIIVYLSRGASVFAMIKVDIEKCFGQIERKQMFPLDGILCENDRIELRRLFSLCSLVFGS